ncbi:MAG: nuclear transport factor 2 family protein [Bacteroidales bacterium]|nr:nuclear transport factor 2 family protein [Bacteroidales bacterium]MCF8350099.1 nuclear transport factor 2 family protein [Bacteroidales bacterium]MCF8376157.1 nuclear transport factor 2 family protein [Bacteroidales bacterium]
MKNTILFSLIVMVFFAGCDQKEKTSEVDLAAEKMQIENVLDQYVMANENQDFSIIETIWAEDDDIVLFGTDMDEKLVGWEQIKSAIQKQFTTLDSTYISIQEQTINLNKFGTTAWFSEVLNYNFIYEGKSMSYEGIRFTGVLRKTGGNWELVQGHLSIPADVDFATENNE